MRECKVCKESKPLLSFPKRSGTEYRRYECRECTAEWAREYRASNKHKIRCQKASSTYGISVEEADELYATTHCDICDKELSNTGHIDHCHTTNVVRGVLCNRCNLGIGYFDDDTKKMAKAIEYLKHYGKPAIGSGVILEDGTLPINVMMDL